jgi:hypothetical protein
MCNILGMKCSHRGCKEEIEMHLADYATDPDEVKVFCDKHIPEYRESGVLWAYKDKKRIVKVFVNAMTNNAKECADGNHPNQIWLKRLESFGTEVVEEFR